jgi:hypothetical protein
LATARDDNGLCAARGEAICATAVRQRTAMQPGVASRPNRKALAVMHETGRGPRCRPDGWIVGDVSMPDKAAPHRGGRRPLEHVPGTALQCRLQTGWPGQPVVRAAGRIALPVGPVYQHRLNDQPVEIPPRSIIVRGAADPRPASVHTPTNAADIDRMTGSTGVCHSSLTQATFRMACGSRVCDGIGQPARRAGVAVHALCVAVITPPTGEGVSRWRPSRRQPHSRGR